jgi:hypothetical protein
VSDVCGDILVRNDDIASSRSFRRRLRKDGRRGQSCNTQK